MNDQSWVLLDVETAGLSTPVVVEVAAQRMRGWQPEGEPFRRFLNHGASMSAEVSRQHGLTRAQIERDGEDPLLVHAEFATYVRDLPLVAFDLQSGWHRHLGAEWSRLGLPRIGKEGFCALRLSQRLLDPVPVVSGKLQTLRQYYKLPDPHERSAWAEVQTGIDLMQVVLKPLSERRGLIQWDDVCQHASEVWFPSRITFGEFKGRHFRDALTDTALRAWLEWLANSSTPRSAQMGQWYLLQLSRADLEVDDAVPEVQSTAPRGDHGEPTLQAPAATGVLTFVKPAYDELKALIASARMRLADLEARYTQERHEIEVTQAALFALLRPHYQQRDRLRLAVGYRKQYLETLMYEGEEAAEAIALQCEEAAEQTDAEYEAVAANASEQKTLPEDEARELKHLWRKLVRLFHPDRFANDTQKLAVFEQLTIEINRARDAGDVKRLREIAQDPNAFLLKQGWGDLDFSESLEFVNLRKHYEALQLQIVMVIEALNDLHKEERYELHKLSLERPSYLEEVAEAHVMGMADELVALRDEAQNLGAEIEMLTGRPVPDPLSI